MMSVKMNKQEKTHLQKLKHEQQVIKSYDEQEVLKFIYALDPPKT